LRDPMGSHPGTEWYVSYRAV